jgi:hypothetical protein
MKILSTRVHGVLDYVVSLFVMGSPWIFGFARGGLETWTPVVLGAAGIIYSICTNYELGVVKSLSMRTHLVLDLLSGALLALSPWIFGFSEFVYLPHLIIGIMEIVVALITDPVPALVSGPDHRYMHSPRTDASH